jgi:hypothetical protein
MVFIFEKKGDKKELIGEIEQELFLKVKPYLNDSINDSLVFQIEGVGCWCTTGNCEYCSNMERVNNNAK